MDAGVPRGVVLGLQERAAAAFPTEYVERVDGWWLRCGGGGAWWASSVLPHGGAGAAGLVGRVAGAEALYARHGVDARFQITPGVCPAGLDEVLAGRGYRVEFLMLLQAARAGDVLDRLVGGGMRVVVDDRPGRAWFETWWAVHGDGGSPRGEWEMLRRVERPSGYAMVLASGGVVAVGRAVADGGWAGVYGMATLPDARGVGAAGRVLGALAAWALDQHANRLYLRVEPDNGPARRLYARAGFTDVARYHYRTRP